MSGPVTVDFEGCSVDPQLGDAVPEVTLLKVGQEMLAGLKTNGFVLVANSGFNDDVVETIHTGGHAFFNSSEEEKQSMAYTNEKRGGYDPEYFGKLKNQDFPAEGYFYRPYPSHQDRERYPEERRHPGYMAALDTYWWRCAATFRRVMQCLALALGKPKDLFDTEYMKALVTKSLPDNSSCLRHLYYHSFNKSDVDEKKHRLRQHYDWHYVTLILPDGPGLKYQAKDGEWMECPWQKDLLVVQAGLNLQRLIQGVHAPVHYVGVPSTPGDVVPVRQSLVYFSCPDNTTPVCALGESPEGKQLYIDWETERYVRYFDVGYDGLNKEESAFVY